MLKKEKNIMKRILSAVVVCCMVLGGAVGVLASDYYVAGNAGINFDTGTDVQDVDFDEGYQVSAAVGNKVTDHVRVEAEYQFLDTDMSLDVYTLMGNAYYDIATFNGFTPYVTTGIGIGWFDGDIISDNSVVYKVGAGVDYDINTDWQVGVRYTYLDAIDNIDYDTNQVGVVLTYNF